MLSEKNKTKNKETNKQKKTETDHNITRHNVIAISRDQQLWRSSFSLIQICLHFFFK